MIGNLEYIIFNKLNNDSGKGFGQTFFHCPCCPPDEADAPLLRRAQTNFVAVDRLSFGRRERGREGCPVKLDIGCVDSSGENLRNQCRPRPPPLRRASAAVSCVRRAADSSRDFEWRASRPADGRADFFTGCLLFWPVVRALGKEIQMPVRNPNSALAASSERPREGGREGPASAVSVWPSWRLLQEGKRERGRTIHK